MQLPDLQALNLDAIQDGLSIVAAGHPMSKLGQDMQSLSEAFAARGIYHLLLELDVGRFVMNLQRSAQARRYFLRKSREQQSTDNLYIALSRTDAIFDCIAGGDWRLATEIRSLSPEDWTPEGEYPEDFCYHALLHAYVAAAVQRTGLEAAQAVRARLELIVADIQDSAIDVTRLDLCTAFLAGDEVAFWKTFEQLVEISGAIAADVPLADGRVFEFPWLAADRFVSIELLAWIALARSRGFRPPQPEYNRCPSVAWLNGRVEMAEDVFLMMEAQFGL
jgi:immunity protein 49 of polymorphic toxin system